MCDKLTYLPALIGFAYAGILSVKLIWALVVVELFGHLNLQSSHSEVHFVSKTFRYKTTLHIVRSCTSQNCVFYVCGTLSDSLYDC